VSEPSIRRVPEITAEQENLRTVPLFPDGSFPNIVTSRRDPVEPVPVGSYVARIFRVTGYDPDCDGSLMARLEAVDAEGEPTGWTVTHMSLHPGCAWILDRPDALDRAAAPVEAATPGPRECAGD
jgi:hypothetical protein